MILEDLLNRSDRRSLAATPEADALVAFDSEEATGVASGAVFIPAAQSVAGVAATASALFGGVGTGLGAASVLAGCIGYDWDSMCKAQGVTAVVGVAFLSAPPAAGSIFGLLTTGPYMVPGVAQRRDEQWAQAHG